MAGSGIDLFGKGLEPIRGTCAYKSRRFDSEQITKCWLYTGSCPEGLDDECPYALEMQNKKAVRIVQLF